MLTIGFAATAYAQEVHDPDAASPNIAAFMVGGGVTGFSDTDTSRFIGVGGSWTARLAIGTRSPIALETAYVGTLNDVEALGLDTDAFLLSHGLEAALRWNMLATLGHSQRGYGWVETFFYAGVGYRQYKIVNEDFNTSDIRDSDNMGEVPFGFGIAFSRGGFVLDMRGGAVVAFDDDLFKPKTRAALNRWDASLRMGFEF